MMAMHDNGKASSVQASEMAMKPQYHVHVPDKKTLKNIYMPFLKHGGIFIATEKVHQLNEQVVFSMQLLEDKEKYIIAGKVAWLNPKFVQAGRSQGMGVQFTGKESRMLHDKIENLLAGFSHDASTQETM